MTNAREEILGGIRRRLGRTNGDAAAVDQRLAARRSNLVPARGRPAPAERLARFVEMAEAAQCTVARIASPSELPAAVGDWLSRHNLAAALVMAPDPRLDAVPWQSQPLLSIRRGAPEEADAVGLGRALTGIAETGTLLVASGPEAPTTLSFLPENHIVVLDAAAIVGSYEDAFARLRAAHPGENGAALPRAVSLITGPSRTGDIALKIELGAHGPRRVHIIILEQSGIGDDPPA